MTDWMSRLCAYVGVHATYRGYDGQTISVSPETQRRVLNAMGLDIETQADARATLEKLQAQDAARPLPLDRIVKAGASAELTLAHPAEWTLIAENGEVVLGRGHATDQLSLPPLAIGIHKLHLTSATGDHTTWILARPDRAIQLADHVPEARIWGGLCALYGSTDGDAVAIGTYDLLGKYAAGVARHGADFLGINPVHAMGQTRPDDLTSPYSPSHRAALNTWHCAWSNGAKGTPSDLIDYPSALENARKAQAAEYAAFCAQAATSPAKKAFAAFLETSDATLHEYAVFEALAAKHGSDWQDWPAVYRDHDLDALTQFADDHAAEIEQEKWAQWCAECQLADAQAAAKAAGMRVGLYLDLAVGPRLGGAETWDKNTPLVTGATLGAPPDPLGPNGQSWGLAPLSPLACRLDGYAGFARLLRSTMRHAGMIRIDHALGLMRSFWIPQGATEGTYVDYPCDALLSVVAIESVRNNTIVVGEDLGLVPEGLRQKLAAVGIYGLDVLQYMRTSTGGFKSPSDTREMAICSFATHDTPTIAGFFAAQDAHVRAALGGIDAAALADTKADRARALATLTTHDPVSEIHNRLARSKASMVAVQFDDVARQTSQQNLPGTVETHPNWRRKSPFTLEQISTSTDFDALGKTMHAQGRSNPISQEQNYDVTDCSDLTN